MSGRERLEKPHDGTVKSAAPSSLSESAVCWVLEAEFWAFWICGFQGLVGREQSWIVC